jgi:hypothetical protein
LNLVVHLAISDQITGWYSQIGPWLFYGAIWALVFAGTGLLVGAFVPFAVRWMPPAGVPTARLSDSRLSAVLAGSREEGGRGACVEFPDGAFFGKHALRKTRQLCVVSAGAATQVSPAGRA